jgi:hypothetical protein
VKDGRMRARIKELGFRNHLHVAREGWQDEPKCFLSG